MYQDYTIILQLHPWKLVCSSCYSQMAMTLIILLLLGSVLENEANEVGYTYDY